MRLIAATRFFEPIEHILIEPDTGCVLFGGSRERQIFPERLPQRRNIAVVNVGVLHRIKTLLLLCGQARWPMGIKCEMRGIFLAHDDWPFAQK